MSAAQEDRAGPDPERAATRAAVALARPGAWLQPDGRFYAVRAGADGRRRAVLRLDEAGFRALARAAVLKLREEGGWTLSREPARVEGPPPGRPGVLEGERTVAEADGRLVARRANLGESPLAWLARRKDADGRPFLSPVEVAAGERLREDFHRAGTLGRLTMSWDGMPRSGGGGGPRVDPAEQGRQAKARLAAALEAVGPGLREVLEHVCLAGTALEAAERDLGLTRRSGKTVLKLALRRLAIHYRLAR